jgi:PIN domain nuclease of toxin-antitoxin system
LDASAVLAFVKGEPGGDAVLAHVGTAAISAVNLQEVVKELALVGMSAGEAAEVLGDLHLDVRPHDAAAAYGAGMLVTATKRYGRGLGDRTCMALGIAMGLPVLTADREWRCVAEEGAVEGLVVEFVR